MECWLSRWACWIPSTLILMHVAGWQQWIFRNGPLSPGTPGQISWVIKHKAIDCICSRVRHSSKVELQQEEEPAPASAPNGIPLDCDSIIIGPRRSMYLWGNFHWGGGGGGFLIIHYYSTIIRNLKLVLLWHKSNHWHRKSSHTSLTMHVIPYTYMLMHVNDSIYMQLAMECTQLARNLTS